VCPRHLRRSPKDKWSVWDRVADTAHWNCITYRLLAWSFVLVVVSQLHGIAHVGHADAEWRGFTFPYISTSVTALGTTAGPNTLPAIGDTRCLVTLLCGEIVRQGQRRVGRAQARYIAERGRRGCGGRDGGLQVGSGDLGVWLWWCWCFGSCRCRDLGVSCHGSGCAHASERDRGAPECESRSRGAKSQQRRKQYDTLTALHACYGGRWCGREASRGQTGIAIACGQPYCWLLVSTPP